MDYFDMHVHSTFSCDGEATMDEMCIAAIKQGVTKIAFTEHWDVAPGSIGEQHYMDHESEIPQAFLEIRKKYLGRLEIFQGIELGQPMHNLPQAKKFLHNHSFDFILGSIHYYRDENNEIQDVYYVDYEHVPPRQMFKEYFEEMMRLIDLRCFDVLAHLDYPVRVLESYLSTSSLVEFSDLILPVLELAASNDIGLEISTRGLADWQKRVGPEVWILKKYREFGGKILTLGSDGHNIHQVGTGMKEACEAAVAAGFKEICYFRSREPHFVPISFT